MQARAASASAATRQAWPPTCSVEGVPASLLVCSCGARVHADEPPSVCPGCDMPEGRPEDSAEPLVRVGRRLVPLRLFEAEVIVDAAATICRLRAWSAIPSGALILLATQSGSAALGAALGALVSCQGTGLSKRQGAAR